MVPSIYPLETLHNSLSLKQVDDFLSRVCESSSEAHAKTMKGETHLQAHLSSGITWPDVSFCSPVQPVWLSESVVSLLSSASSVLVRLWDVSAAAESQRVAWVCHQSWLITRTLASSKLMGWRVAVFQRAVSPPAACPALAPPPPSQTTPPPTSPLTNKLGNKLAKVQPVAHARTLASCWRTFVKMLGSFVAVGSCCWWASLQLLTCWSGCSLLWFPLQL